MPRPPFADAAPLRLVIFDYDGTLADSHASFHQAIEAACHEVGITPPLPEDTRGKVGLATVEAIHALLPDAPPSTLRAFGDALHRARRFQRAGTAPLDALFPHAKAVIQTLYDWHVLMAVATNKSRRGLDHSLSAHGIERYFVTSRTPDETHPKPNPAMVREILSYTGVDAANAVFLGDTAIDMACARGAGVAAIGAAWGYHDRAELERGGARLVIGGFTELGPALRQVWSRAA